MSAWLEVTQVFKRYDEQTPVLKGVDLQIEAGSSTAILGPSGCGKSTLLNLIGTLDRPDEGTITLDGAELAVLSEKEQAKLRNDRIGFVFQLHHLLPQCTVLENVLVPSLVHPDRNDARKRAESLLERVGLSHRLLHRPGQLSGGERQRVALVRALINRPDLLLADEPTGALNREAADTLMELLLELNREEKLTLLLVTHDTHLAERAERTVNLKDGRVQ